MRRLTLSLLLALGLSAQTRVKPTQVRNWTQLRHPGGAGTKLAINQIELGGSHAIGVWEQAASRSTYPAQYRIAVVTTQTLPVLITCYERTATCPALYPLWFNQPNTP